MKSWSLLFVLSVVLAATIASSASPKLSEEVVKNLEALYEHNRENNWQLQKYPEPDLIILLNSNEGYRGALESTVYDWDKFYKQVLHIIEKEYAWKWKDVATPINLASAAIGVYNVVCFFYGCGSAKAEL